MSENKVNTTFGEVDYNADVFGGGEGNKKNDKKKDEWMRLGEGSNEMRLVTQPHQYMVHKYQKDPTNPKDFGQKVSCSMIHGSCPLCDAGNKAKPRWFYGVIDRKTGTYKILDVSFAVFGSIRKLARNQARWGDPQKYDIDIVVDKHAPSPAQYYTVQPISKEPLSAADQLIKDGADLDELKRKCTPLTPEQVQKRLDKINGVATNGAPAAAPTAKSNGKAAAKAPTVSMTDDEELDQSFPDYNGDSAEA